VGKVVGIETDKALADIEGNLVAINIDLTPEASIGSYVLIHAGFAITKIDEEDGLEIKALLNKMAEVLDNV
jgi:hydrogenase expression/formation protein HypC